VALQEHARHELVQPSCDNAAKHWRSDEGCVDDNVDNGIARMRVLQTLHNDGLTMGAKVQQGLWTH
jgi:hypothetical protein